MESTKQTPIQLRDVISSEEDSERKSSEGYVKKFKFKNGKVFILVGNQYVEVEVEADSDSDSDSDSVWSKFGSDGYLTDTMEMTEEEIENEKTRYRKQNNRESAPDEEQDF